MEDFFVKLGLRKELATKLSKSDIKSPQELAGTSFEKLSAFTDDHLLLNILHPILHKKALEISLAQDPYKAALEIVKNHVQSSGSTGDNTNPSHSTASDAVAEEPVGHNHATSSSSQSSTAQRGATSSVNMPISNVNLTFNGGNFSQAAIMSQGTQFHNYNTCVSATSADGVREKTSPESNSTTQNSTCVSGDELHWKDHSDYEIGNIDIPRSDWDMYEGHMDKDDVYDIRCHGSSRALIINNITFDDSRMNRDGAENDCKNMENALNKLGFKVQRENNKTAAEIRSLIQDFAKNRNQNAKADMVALYIGSHGERDERGFDTFMGRDGQYVNFDDIKKMFHPENCRLMRNKPKLFFLQFCRQSNRESNDQPVPAPAPIESEQVQSDTGGFNDGTRPESRTMDMLCGFATGAGNAAYRNTQNGSWFVTSLIRILTDNAHKDDLLSMLTKVNNCVSSREGRSMADVDGGVAVQISEVVHNLRKKVFFYPGLGDDE